MNLDEVRRIQGCRVVRLSIISFYIYKQRILYVCCLSAMHTYKVYTFWYHRPYGISSQQDGCSKHYGHEPDCGRCIADCIAFVWCYCSCTGGCRGCWVVNRNCCCGRGRAGRIDYLQRLKSACILKLETLSSSCNGKLTVLIDVKVLWTTVTCEVTRDVTETGKTAEIVTAFVVIAV